MKNKKMNILIAGLLAALVVVGIVGATHAFAQNSNTIQLNGSGFGPGGGHGFGLGQAELAAAAKALHELYEEGGIPADMRMAFVAGVGISALVGFVVIALFLRYLKRSTLLPFVYYRIIFGIIVLALAFFRPPAG